MTYMKIIKTKWKNNFGEAYLVLFMVFPGKQSGNGKLAHFMLVLPFLSVGLAHFLKLT